MNSLPSTIGTNNNKKNPENTPSNNNSSVFEKSGKDLPNGLFQQSEGFGTQFLSLLQEELQKEVSKSMAEIGCQNFTPIVSEINCNRDSVNPVIFRIEVFFELLGNRLAINSQYSLHDWLMFRDIKTASSAFVEMFIHETRRAMVDSILQSNCQTNWNEERIWCSCICKITQSSSNYLLLKSDSPHSVFFNIDAGDYVESTPPALKKDLIKVAKVEFYNSSISNGDSASIFLESNPKEEAYFKPEKLIRVIRQEHVADLDLDVTAYNIHEGDRIQINRKNKEDGFYFVTEILSPFKIRVFRKVCEDSRKYKKIGIGNLLRDRGEWKFS